MAKESIHCSSIDIEISIRIGELLLRQKQSSNLRQKQQRSLYFKNFFTVDYVLCINILLICIFETDYHELLHK